MNSVLSADLDNPGHVRPIGFREFVCAAREELLESRWPRHDQHARGLITDVLKLVNDATRHERSSAQTDFLPFFI
jgi:hypothetical protein